MADLIGQRLGQYEITALLGEGGMAAVYRAHDLTVKRDVAIKVIKHHLLNKDEFIQRFEREANTVASLSHPFILKVFTYGEAEDMVYLVMELMVGGTLAQQIRRGPLPVDQTSRMLDQIASALDYAHQKGILHRDLKPHNVLLDEAGNAHLSDFGIAKLLNETSVLTQSGAVMGTPAYMSPEQWQGQPLDARADLYSLAVMLFEMLTGGLPFTADTPVGLMHKHMSVTPPSLRTIRGELPEAVEDVVQKALAKEPADRYVSASAFADAFKAALQGGTVAHEGATNAKGKLATGSESMSAQTMVQPAGTTKLGNPPSRRNMFGLGALVVVVVAIVLLVLGRSSAPQNPGTAQTQVSVVAVAATVANPTETPTDKATVTNTVPATVAVSVTNTVPPTPAVAATSIPTTSPTLSETATTVPLGSGVKVTFRDNFDSDNWVNSNSWDSYGSPNITVNGGVLSYQGDAWASGIARSSFHPGTGVLVLFKTDSDTDTDIGLFSVEQDATNLHSLRSWYLGSNHSTAQLAHETGSSDTYTVAKEFSIQPNTWYYLLYRVASGGRFYTQVWERDNPSAFLLNDSRVPTADDWSKFSWSFLVIINTGTINLQSYQELSFPAGYQQPAVPPSSSQ